MTIKVYRIFINISSTLSTIFSIFFKSIILYTDLYKKEQKRIYNYIHTANNTPAIAHTIPKNQNSFTMSLSSQPSFSK